MTRAIRVFRITTLAGYFALLTLVLNWYTWLAPPQVVPTSIALAITAVPLLFPLRGLLHARVYTHAWTSFLALPYFALGIDAIAVGIGPVWLGWAVVLASITLFAATLGYVRTSARAARA